VSFQIRQLETELGVSLFDRINHTIALTDKGREMLQYAHEIMKIAGDMEKAASGDRAIGGLVRIAIAQSLCDWLLTERFAALHTDYPGITMKIIAGDTEEMFRLLGRNEADLVFTLDNHIYHRDYVLVEEEQLGVYCVVGMEARFKPVSLLYRDEDFALVREESGVKSESLRLRSGDEVITSARDLYDGKVIR
jgi:DNA-binding transcriptional LysR family regulator